MRISDWSSDMCSSDLVDIFLEDDEYEGKPKSVITSFFPASEYEGADADGSSDDEDEDGEVEEEEYEDEVPADEDDEDTDDYDDEDEEDDEEPAPAPAQPARKAPGRAHDPESVGEGKRGERRVDPGG